MPENSRLEQPQKRSGIPTRRGEIYHITTEADWLAALTAGSYTADSLASEGFIHCSEARQVVPVAEHFFHGRQDLVLLQINLRWVAAPIRFENLEGGDDLFPHIYGPLNIDAVVRVHRFAPNPEGGFSLPTDAGGSG
ncbi:MAG: DUF952 domain-containing protein [Anaerolineaceae bacterium]|nr:DUF952 domain-containing protein [Anaerolineaceae bacterium]